MRRRKTEADARGNNRGFKTFGTHASNMAAQNAKSKRGSDIRCMRPPPKRTLPPPCRIRGFSIFIL
eukprot:scaffold13277_cov114-Isochrysis_galbana.AAC.11